MPIKHLKTHISNNKFRKRKETMPMLNKISLKKISVFLFCYQFKYLFISYPDDRLAISFYWCTFHSLSRDFEMKEQQIKCNKSFFILCKKKQQIITPRHSENSNNKTIECVKWRRCHTQKREFLLSNSYCTQDIFSHSIVFLCTFCYLLNHNNKSSLNWCSHSLLRSQQQE